MYEVAAHSIDTTRTAHVRLTDVGPLLKRRPHYLKNRPGIGRYNLVSALFSSSSVIGLSRLTTACRCRAYLFARAQLFIS